MARAVVFGCQGRTLRDTEAAFFRDANPWGFILFQRNLETTDQIRRLTGDLRDAVGRDAPILIDQEGGRVARLTPPGWSGWTNALDFVSRLPTPAVRIAAMRLRYSVIAAELRALGIDVNCAPLGDIARPDTSPPIRERLYGTEPRAVAELARAVADGLADGGVLPVLKHIPGHGRATLDSHFDLPRVTASLKTLREGDFYPFRQLSDLPMGMTAHVVFEALDPDRPATQSPDVIQTIRAEIGFDGLLLTDDLSMQALSGDF
ncbi:MAG: glycoside hydrolase family 3 N-terminal domain-containing protein, partial [Pseudomonadota bacterium]